MYQHYKAYPRDILVDSIYFISITFFVLLLVAPFFSPLSAIFQIYGHALRTYTSAPYPSLTQFSHANNHLRIDCQAGWFSQYYVTPHTASEVILFYQQHGFHTSSNALTLEREGVTIQILTAPSTQQNAWYSIPWLAFVTNDITSYTINTHYVANEDVYNQSSCWHD
jgi:hypothetical protein